MVIINGREVPSIRELVIEEQKRRTTRIDDEFVERMENNLIRWKPSDSSHHGAILAVNGRHPYQQPTAEEMLSMRVANLKKNKRRARLNRKKGKTGEERTSVGDTLETKILGIIGKWFTSVEESDNGNNDGTDHGKGSILDPNLFGNDDESFAPRTRCLENVDTDTETLMAYTASSLSLEENGNQNTSTNGAGPEGSAAIASDSDLELYRSYYKHPIPVSYLNSIRGKKNDKPLTKSGRQQQQQQQPEEGDSTERGTGLEQKLGGGGSGWLRLPTCLSSALCSD